MKIIKISIVNYDWLKNFGTSPNKGLDYLRMYKPLQERIEELEEKINHLADKFIKGDIYKS